MSENGSLGAVRVANEVIASIAALAACEVEGVESMDEAAARHFGDWVRRQGAHRGVRVHIEGDRSIHLEVFITVDSEAKLADVAASVQANVAEATERMLGLEVGEVNVFVSSAAFARYPRPSANAPQPRSRRRRVLSSSKGRRRGPE